jgi:hypothetical protein
VGLLVALLLAVWWASFNTRFFSDPLWRSERTLLIVRATPSPGLGR